MTPVLFSIKIKSDIIGPFNISANKMIIILIINNNEHYLNTGFQSTTLFNNVYSVATIK